MKKYNITAPKEFTDKSTGEVKTTYPQVGRAVIFDPKDGKKETIKIELFMFAGVEFVGFIDEPRDNNSAPSNGFKQKVAPTEQGNDSAVPDYPEEEIDLSDIPF